MLKKVINLILICAIIMSMPFVVNAEVIKDDNNGIVYTLEKVGEECLANETLWILGMDSNNNYIYSNTSLNRFYKDEGQSCRLMSVSDTLEYIKNGVKDEYIGFDDENFAISKDVVNTLITEHITKTAYVCEELDLSVGDCLKRDVEFLKGREDGNGYDLASPNEIVESNISNIYERQAFKPVDSTTIDDSKNYYYFSENGNIIDSIEHTEVQNDIKDDEYKIFDYFLFAKEGIDYESRELVSLDINKFDNIRINDAIYDEDSEQAFIIGMDVDTRKTYLYDLNGTAIKELNDYNLLVKFDNLYGISSYDTFALYNKNFDKLYESNNLSLDVFLKYGDYIYYTFGRDIDGMGYYYNINEHKLLSEDNQVFNNEDLIIKFSGKLDKLVTVTVNGEELSEQNYTKESGSTIITLNKDYLSKLEKGTYTLKVEYSDGGYASSNFIIGLSNPSTFDGITTSFIVLGLSLLGIAFTTIYLKKRNLKKN